jgi:hypothetical protein
MRIRAQSHTTDLSRQSHPEEYLSDEFDPALCSGGSLGLRIAHPKIPHRHFGVRSRCERSNLRLRETTNATE